MAFRFSPARASSRRPNAVEVRIEVINDLGHTVRLCWLNYEGEPTRETAVDHTGSFSQRTWSTHPWRLSHGSTSDEMACVCFVESGRIRMSAMVPMQVCIPHQRKSGYDERGDVSVKVHNDLDVAVDVAWLDYRGTPEPRGHLKPGEVFTQRTNSQHPWQFTSGSNELACVLFCATATVELSVAVELCRGVNSPLADRVETCSKAYERRQLEGFTFFVERGDHSPELAAIMAADAAEVVRVLPPAAVELLRKRTAVWVNRSFCYGPQPPVRGMCTHWSAKWLSSHGNLPEKEGCVECYCSQDWVDWHAMQPAMLLHELCHAYHKHTGLDVEGPYAVCMASGRYVSGEYLGRDAAPYCTRDAREFFAETCEAFFSSVRFRNDYFPYVHSELKGFDQDAYCMVERAFGVCGAELPVRAEFPEDWATGFAKLEVARQPFTGVLKLHEFMEATERAGLGTPSEAEASAALRLADVDADGGLNYHEFVSWATSVAGAYVKR